MTPTLPRKTIRRRRSERGQAMLEYSLLNWVLVVALVLSSTVRIIPGPEGKKVNVIEMFLTSYQAYYNSFYFVLNLPFP